MPLRVVMGGTNELQNSNPGRHPKAMVRQEQPEKKKNEDSDFKNSLILLKQILRLILPPVIAVVVVFVVAAVDCWYPGVYVPSKIASHQGVVIRKHHHQAPIVSLTFNP